MSESKKDFSPLIFRSLWTVIACGVFALMLWLGELNLFNAILSFEAQQTVQLANTLHFVSRLVIYGVDYLLLAWIFVPSRQDREDWDEEEKLSIRMKKTCWNVDYLIWVLSIAVVVLFLPIRSGLAYQEEGVTAVGEELLGRLILWLFCTLLGVLVSVGGGGLRKGDPDAHPALRWIKIFFKVIVSLITVSVAGEVIPPFFSVFMQLGRASLRLPVQIFIGVFLLVLLLLCRTNLSRVLKMRKTVNQFFKFCKEHNFPVTNIKTGFLSYLLFKKYCGFDVEAGGKVYSCRVCGFLFRFIPAVFEADFKGRRPFEFRFSGVSYFTVNKRFRYEIKGEGEKILLISRPPKSIFVTQPNGTPEPADNSDVPVDKGCTIYTGLAFANLLERTVR